MFGDWGSVMRDWGLATRPWARGISDIQVKDLGIGIPQPP